MPKLFTSLILLLVIVSANAQQPVLQWARAFTNGGDNSLYRDLSNGRTVGVDNNGNVYSAGLFQYTVDFDPGPGVYTLTAANPSETAIYISKLDANGNFVWAKQLPVLVEWAPIEMKVDGSGNVYLAANFQENADMDPGPGVHMISPTGFRDAFVIKLDSNGNLVWVKQFGGPGDTGPESTGIDLDRDGNVIVCGTFNNTVDFDPGPATFNLISTAHMQSFIVKLNSSGDLVWALQFGNSPVVYQASAINDIKCDKDGNIYTTGTFSGDCDFDPGDPVYNMRGVSLSDGFISKLDANGHFVWAKRIGIIDSDYYQYIQPRGIDIDSKGNVVTTGYLHGAFDFDPGPGVHLVSNSQKGVGEGYLLKLNTNGDFTWVKKVDSHEGGEDNDLAIDGDDNIYVIGDFFKPTDFDPGPGVYTIPGTDEYLYAVMKLDAGGNLVYATAFQSGDNAGCLLRRMAVDDAQNIYITGYMAGTMDFDPGPNVFPLTSTMDESPFVVKLGRCSHPTTAELHINTCSSYVLNNESFDTTGVYKRIIPNSYGCDSVITLYLVINKPLSEQTVTLCEGESFFAGGAYRSTAGVYRDTLQTTQGCDSIVTTHLIVHPKPLPDLGADRDLCNNSEATITPGNFKSYLWQDMSEQKSLTVSAAGTYWVKVANEFNCFATDTLTIRSILPSPEKFLKPTDSVCGYESLPITVAGSYNAYLWSNRATTKDITVEQPGIYWLKVTDVHQCTGIDSITIVQKQCTGSMFVPTAFTPNRDGRNDVFRVKYPYPVKAFHMIIYNRWGQPVFETKDITKGWDGTLHGLDASMDTYVWIISLTDAEGKKQSVHGTVTLLR